MINVIELETTVTSHTQNPIYEWMVHLKAWAQHILIILFLYILNNSNFWLLF